MSEQLPPRWNVETNEAPFLPAHWMSLRDYFAAKAMMFVYQQRVALVAEGKLGGFGWSGVASGAYEVADAMLDARKR